MNALLLPIVLGFLLALEARALPEQWRMRGPRKYVTWFLSRSRAYALTDDPYAEDPWCSYQPGSFPYPDDLARFGLRPTLTPR